MEDTRTSHLRSQGVHKPVCRPGVQLVPAGSQQNDVVQLLKDLLSRLVDDRAAGEAQPRDTLQRVAHGQRAGGIQPGRRLVQAQEQGCGGKFNADVDPLALAATDAARHIVAHDPRQATKAEHA